MNMGTNAGVTMVRSNSATTAGVESGRTAESAPILVTLHSVGRGKFTASFNGRPLVERPCSSIIFAACRALVAAGIADGPVRFRHAASAHTFDVEVKSIFLGAKLVVVDRQRDGLCIESWSSDDEE